MAKEPLLCSYGVNVSFLPVFIAALSVFIITRVIKLSRGLKAVNHLPGMRVPFQPLDFPGAVIPTFWWNPGLRFPWVWRSHFYKRFHTENVSVIPFITGVPGIYTSNLDVARQVIAGGHKSSFMKPEFASRALLIWGMNLVASDGEMWRKHRRIMGPAFNSKLYRMVWSESLRTYREMVTTEGWDNKGTVDIPIVQELTLKFALLIIGKCGFGFSFDWATPPKAPDGSMSTQEALDVFAQNHMLVLFVPKWILRLPFKKFQDAREAHEQLMRFMRAQVRERRDEIQSQDSAPEKSDVFTMLVQANENETTKLQLDDQELIGNIYVLLLAGHDTTASALAATIGFLSLYEDLQQDVLDQIVSVVGYDRDPVFEDYPNLDKVLAAFYEALRMFPAGHLMIREAAEDTVLIVPNPPGQEGIKTLPVLKGTHVVVDMIGLQYNPRYFDEPETYKPWRWYKDANPPEVFSAFSFGPRECIGRKFATTEAVAFLTMLLRDWKVEPIVHDGETKDAWRDRVLDARIKLTLGVADVPVKFSRRKKAQ